MNRQSDKQINTYKKSQNNTGKIEKYEKYIWGAELWFEKNMQKVRNL